MPFIKFIVYKLCSLTTKMIQKVAEIFDATQNILFKKKLPARYSKLQL